MDGLFLFFPRVRPLVADTIVCPVCYWAYSGAGFTRYARKPTVMPFLHPINVIPTIHRWLIDTDRDTEGMRILADLHGGSLTNPIAVAEFKEIKDKVQEEVRLANEFIISSSYSYVLFIKRDSGEVRSYHSMWKKYQRRVLLAMSSQAFAQLVRHYFCLSFHISLISDNRME